MTGTQQNLQENRHERLLSGRIPLKTCFWSLMPKIIGSGSLVPSQNSQEICSRTLVPSIIPTKIGFRSLMPCKKRKKNRLKEPGAKQKSPRKAAQRPGANKIPKKSNSKGPGPIFLEIFARHKAHQLIFRGVARHQAHEPIFLSTRLPSRFCRAPGS